MPPLISVVITTYNQAAYIGQAIETALAQTYRPFEVVVVDDGSTDDTPARIASFGNRVHYIRQKNQGVAGSRNTGIRNARGEYIAFLDGDDLWDPEKLAVQVAAARQYPDSGMIVVDGVQFDGPEIMRASLFGDCCDGLPADSVTTACYYYHLLNRPFICTTSQILVPSRIFETVGMSNSRFKGASDYDLYLRIAAQFDVTIIKKRLIRWRYHPGSVSGPREFRALRYLSEDISILNNHARDKDKNLRAQIRRVIRQKLDRGAEKLYNYGLETDRVHASRVLLKLLFRNPTYPIPVFFLAGLWCPAVVRSNLGPLVRKMFVRKG